jgi:ribosomal-protein-alanine N-acetyltransferase
MVKFRLMKEEDLQQIAELERESFTDPYPIDFLRLLYRLSPDLFIVAEEKIKTRLEIFGYTVAQIYELGQAQVGHILSIAIKKEKRRKGYGSQLVQDLIHRLKTRKCRHVLLEVRVSNRVAIAMYRKLGFHDMDIIQSYYADGEDAVVMVRNLEAVA